MRAHTCVIDLVEGIIGTDADGRCALLDIGGWTSTAGVGDHEGSTTTTTDVITLAEGAVLGVALVAVLVVERGR